MANAPPPKTEEEKRLEQIQPRLELTKIQVAFQEGFKERARKVTRAGAWDDLTMIPTLRSPYTSLYDDPTVTLQ